ncbi:hypothetical protein [uncultured Paraglaciecola sp.]|uniref:hypothetical protein n=1 Tax=uncultured Paraglaciecola sp. TaxID=1765024 RepID=UPI0026346240|nr:hypothetical protein [uncultured Paraglaciecola sp.]
MSELITQTQKLIDIGSFAGGGYILGVLNGIIHKKIDNGHSERKLSIRIQHQRFQDSIKDTQNARKYQFSGYFHDADR